MLSAPALLPAALDPQPGSWWLESRKLEPWQFDLDPDGDLWSTRLEYYAGTDPFLRSSLLAMDFSNSGAQRLLSWNSRTGASYQMLRSPDLLNFTDWGNPISGTGGILEVDLASETAARAFFSLEPLAPLDADGDGLSGVEEGLLGTNPSNADTDGDGFRDGREVLEYRTDPLVFNPSGGTITGVLRTDPNRDGNTADGLPLEGAVVWLDSDFDGEMDDSERRTQTDAAGVYSFPLLAPGFYHVRQFLEPGNTQTLPAEVTPPVLDSWPDQMVSYVHSNSGAAFAGPYGYAADRVWPGGRFVVVGQQLETVDPALILKPAGIRHEVPPIGIYNTTDAISLPTNASITVRFDEIIVDGDGNDLSIIRPVQGSSTELSEVWMGPTANSLTLFGTINQGAGGAVLGLNLTGSPVRPPVQYVKIVSKTNAGVDLGASFTAIQALYFTGAVTDARAVTIVGNETVSGMDFGRFFLDQPPVVLLEDGGTLLRQGVTSPLRLAAQDDIGITARSASGNGAGYTLAGDGTFSVTPAQPGVLDITGSATDTRGQVTTETWRLYVADVNGKLPFDPNTLGASGDDGAPDIRVYSPASGAVVNVATPIVATIGGLSAPNWEIAYAPVDLVDPYDLEAVDPDYIPLAAAIGYRTSETIASFPGNSVADGIYFLRIKATPTAGGPTRYFGQVIAKGVDAATLQPQITLTSPANDTRTGLIQNVIGTITSSRPLNEWFVEVAPREEVDLNDLGSDKPHWKRLARGTTTIPASATLAKLDSSVLPNGPYVIRVVAWNNLRLGRVEARLVEVSGESKFGRHRREFTDVSVDLAGFPLTLKREYDSFDSGKSGDFGYGWSIALVNPQISETVPRTGSGIFGQTAYRDGTRVYITGPDGRRNGFTFHPEFVSPGLFGSNYRATFTADPGCYDKLEVPEGADPFLTVAANGDVKLVFIGLTWNPDIFVLVRPDGTRYTYSETSGFLQAEDLHGNRLAYTPNGFTHSGGLALRFVRDGQGRITSVNAGGTQTWTYTYDAAGDLQSVTDPDNRASTYGYLAAPAHYLASVTDAFGRTGNSFEYDAGGRLAAIVDPAGNRTLQSWDPLGFTGSVTDGRGNVTQLTYDQRGNVLTSINPLGGITRYAYADARHPDKETSETDPLGQVSQHAYDTAGNRTSTVRPGSIFAYETTSWNSFNQPLERRRSDGFIEKWQYDAKGKLTHEELWQQPERDLTYTDGGQVETETISGVATRTEYDSTNGLPREITDPNGLRLTYTRDARGNVTGTTTSGGENVTQVPGSDGLPRTLTDAAGASAGTVVNADGSLTINDWNGGNSRFFRDAQGRTTAIRGPDGFTIQPVKDANGNVTSLTDAVGNQHQSQYDALNRVTRYTDPSGGQIQVAYDVLGRVTERTDRNGRKKRYTWNSLNQVTREQWLDASNVIVRTWTFGVSTHPLSIGRLESVTDGTSTWFFVGGAERPSQVGVTYAGQALYRVNYAWSASNGSIPEQVQVQSNTSGLAHTLRAQAIGGLVYQYRWNAGGFDDRHIRAYYDTMGNEIRLERYSSFLTSDINQAPFAVTHSTRDTKGRATRIRHTDNAGALLFPQADMTLTRTPGGCITSIAEPGNTAAMAYNAGVQLTGVTHTSRANEAYSYDTAGNRLTSHFQPVAATVGAGNRVLTNGNLALEYDAEGNLTRETNTSTGTIREFGYDHNNQLVLVQTKTNSLAAPVVVAAYAYDFAGRVMSRTEGSITTWILYDRLMPIAEFRSGQSDLRRKFFYALDRLDRIFAQWDQVDGERWFLHDHRGSVRGVVRNNGTPVVWADYDAFGQLISGDPALLGDLRFTCRFWSEAALLYENRARHYSPSLGRFIQQDPIMLRGGDLNLYRYVGNDPHNQTDPTGTLAAVEYAVLLADLSEYLLLSGNLTQIGECVCQMIGAAADGLNGVQSSNPAGCIGSALGPSPPGIIGGTAWAIYNPPPGIANYTKACQ